MRKNPIERAAKFHLGKGDKCRRGPLIKSSCFTVIFFRALSLTLPFHYLCSPQKRRKKNCAIVFSCYIFSHYIAIFVRRETECAAHNLPVLSDNPLVVVGVKRGVHGCQIALKTPWKIDLQHFSGPWHYLEGSWIGNLWAGDGIKMSSLLEKKENCPFSPSPSSLKNRQERKKQRTETIEKKRLVYTHLNVVTIPRGLRTPMNIKPLTSTWAWKSEPRQSSFAFFSTWTILSKKKPHVERVSILVIPALKCVQQQKKIK